MTTELNKNQVNNNYLFLIGIDNYSNHSKLQSCVKDCQDFKNLLFEKYDFDPQRTIELYDEKATNYKIQEEIKGCIRSLTTDNNLVIYFSGHGGLEKTTGRGFWIPQDGHSDNYTTWLPNETLLTFIENIKAKHIFIISDCCFARTILITENPKSAEHAHDYDYYPSRWALTSGAEKTWDGSLGENSYFAESVLDCLREAKEDVRVGKLIEFVKHRFIANIRQKPQGYPLHTVNHKGGEFIFKIIDQEIEGNERVKGYKDFLKTLQLYKKNSIFKEITTVEEAKIGYQIFSEYDEVMKKASYFLYLYERTHQARTYEHIKHNHPEVLKDSKSLIILLPKEKGQTKIEIRLGNFNKFFSPLNIFYIDDFLRDQCTPKTIAHNGDKYLDITNFILPYFDYNEEVTDSLDVFNKWFDTDNEPILVVKGTGGIGKTTFAQFLADKFLKKKTKSSVLFIDSTEIFNELIDRVKSFDTIKLYNFYEALFKKTESELEKLNEDQLRLNIDAGNILIIIDGLDEIISKVPKFNVDIFLNSIIQYTSDLGNGKVILTCRSYFWNTAKYDTKELKIVELLPFNEAQSNLFFLKSFNHDKKKVEKAEGISKYFKLPDEKGKYLYHPYLLDVIRSIIQDGPETYLQDEAFNSMLLDRNLKNDYIIFKICQREKKRVGQIVEDEQLKFFIYCAVEKRGVISIENLKEELRQALGKEIDNVNVEAFKSHPFIQLTDKYIRFRYDFFTDYFKSHYITTFLKLENGYDIISENFINLISENCWYGSGMIKDVVNRFTSWSEDNILKVSDLISQIRSSDIPENKKIKTFAGLFNISLLTNIKFTTNAIDQNTYLLKSLFEKGNVISDLAIINVNNNEEVIKFDFSNILFIHCFIDNYQSFWDCNFTNNTIFENCDLFNLELPAGKVIPIPEANFKNCRKDEKFKLSYRESNSIDQKVNERVQEFLEDLFKMFFSKGRLERQGYEIIIKRRFPAISRNSFDFDDTINYLKSQKIIEFFKEFNELKVRITQDCKEDIVRFIKDGTSSKMINSTAAYLSTIIKK